MDSPQSSNAIEFLSFQITQNKHNGPNCHATFLFFPTKDPLHPKRVSLTERGKTHETPKKERNTIHTSLVFSQWIRRWSIVSSLLWQRKHLFAITQPLFCKWSKVRTLPQEASHAKKLNLGCTQEFHIIFEGKKGGKFTFLCASWNTRKDWEPMCNSWIFILHLTDHPGVLGQTIFH